MVDLAQNQDDEFAHTELEVLGRTEDGRPIVFMPQGGGQERFLAAESIYELLFHGTRGNGKTSALIMAFTQNVGRGYGAAWKGVIFRQSHPMLKDVISKTMEWFKPTFGDDCTFNSTESTWTWKTGETLRLSHMEQPKHYDNHHGFGYTFIGWEELTQWGSPELYTKMFSTVRTAHAGIPLMIRATTNPDGPGHNWVRDRFGLGHKWWEDKLIQRSDGRLRGAFYGSWKENKILMNASPDYIKGLVSDVQDPETRKAWTLGSWDIVAGGMFDDVFKAQWNQVPPFEVPPSWRIQRSFDWGASSPFSVGWWAISDGCDVNMRDGRTMSTVRGDIFRIHEWYGCTGKPDVGLDLTPVDIAQGIVEREVQWGLRTTQTCRVSPGPADNQIFDQGANTLDIAVEMQRRVRLDNGQTYKGLYWLRSDKTSGSRARGWQKMRLMMKSGHPNDDGKPREKPGLFVFEGECPEFMRTIMGLQRDDKNRDDLLGKQEDHAADEARYMALSLGQAGGTITTTGLY